MTTKKPTNNYTHTLTNEELNVIMEILERRDGKVSLDTALSNYVLIDSVSVLKLKEDEYVLRTHYENTVIHDVCIYLDTVIDKHDNRIPYYPVLSSKPNIKNEEGVVFKIEDWSKAKKIVASYQKYQNIISLMK